MRISIILMSIALILSLTSCISYDFSRRVVQQGNLLPQEKIERLKIGMSKDDIAILMGTSMLSPMFNNERWDYAYTWRKGSGATETHNLSLFFKNSRLIRVEHQP